MTFKKNQRNSLIYDSFFETIHEHALLIDFSIFILIWIVHLIVYPSFHHISSDCLRTGINHTATGFPFSFFLNDNSSNRKYRLVFRWRSRRCRINAVLFAWLITFSFARIHRYLSENGKSEKLINSLLRGTFGEQSVGPSPLCSWYQY